MNLGMQNSISNEGGYDSLEIENIWQQAVKPDPYLLVSKWADKYRLLSPKSAAEPGRWRTARTPYLRDIMDHLAPSSPVQRIVFENAGTLSFAVADAPVLGMGEGGPLPRHAQ